MEKELAGIDLPTSPAPQSPTTSTLSDLLKNKPNPEAAASDYGLVAERARVAGTLVKGERALRGEGEGRGIAEKEGEKAELMKKALELASVTCHMVLPVPRYSM
ncbi:hypothetical protein HWV62_37017 [Athelia sp. TMB]|nr:hypothetical protein HWV62_37017 [Athelia sp. TMB]